ncbi:MAG: GDP-mannose 4,6-dehydratase [Bdellovibrionales bacterium]|nr:GDP-mannose 4,6-dehydratase [Bdellovibrionales bacterium]
MDHSTVQSQYSKSKVIITGGLGFIGSNLAAALVDMGAEVTLVDSLIPEYGGNLFNIHQIADRVTVNISDVRDVHSMKYLIQGKDYLFNLAGQTSHNDSMADPYPDLDINARAQLSIAEACRHFNPTIKSVFASTRQIYGKPERLPVDENHPIRPVDVNGINKVAGEWYHKLYHDVYGIRTSILRLTNTYGPCMRVCDARQTFLGIWLRRIVEGEPFLIYGDGEQIRDFNYVDDVVQALLLCGASEKANGQVFNLGAEDPMSLTDTARTLQAISPNCRFEYIPFPPERKVIDIGDYYGDYRKIRSLLGWKPKIDLKEGLKRSLDYYLINYRQYWRT